MAESLSVHSTLSSMEIEPGLFECELTIASLLYSIETQDQVVMEMQCTDTPDDVIPCVQATMKHSQRFHGDDSR